MNKRRRHRAKHRRADRTNHRRFMELVWSSEDGTRCTVNTCMKMAGREYWQPRCVHHGGTVN